MSATNKLVLAYSGGLDTSAMLHWLRYEKGYEVICMTADVGQGEELDGLEEKAIASGASKLHIVDLREEFVRDYVYPAIQANAVYEGYYLLGTALARPVIAKAMIDIANLEGASVIAHGATGKGNDQVRFELTAYAMRPDIEIIAPWRTWPYRGRSDLIAYCKRHGIPCDATAEKPYSTDRNLLHISFEGGVLEDPWYEPNEDMYKLSVRPEDAPDESETVLIDFKDGIPVAVNGVQMGPIELLTECNRLGGKHGVGRVDIVENRYVGIKSRGVYETPGGTLLFHAHQAIEQIVLDREVMALRDSLVPQFTRLVYNGYWFAPEMQHLLRFMADTQKGVTGTGRLKLYKGSCWITGRRAPNSLYNAEFSTFEADTVYNQADADGFIKLNALRLKLNRWRDLAVLENPDPAVVEQLTKMHAGYID